MPFFASFLGQARNEGAYLGEQRMKGNMNYLPLKTGKYPLDPSTKLVAPEGGVYPAQRDARVPPKADRHNVVCTGSAQKPFYVVFA